MYDISRASETLVCIYARDDRYERSKANEFEEKSSANVHTRCCCYTRYMYARVYKYRCNAIYFGLVIYRGSGGGGGVDIYFWPIRIVRRVYTVPTMSSSGMCAVRVPCEISHASAAQPQAKPAESSSHRAKLYSPRAYYRLRLVVIIMCAHASIRTHNSLLKGLMLTMMSSSSARGNYVVCERSSIVCIICDMYFSSGHDRMQSASNRRYVSAASCLFLVHLMKISFCGLMVQSQSRLVQMPWARIQVTRRSDVVAAAATSATWPTITNSSLPLERATVSAGLGLVYSRHQRRSSGPMAPAGQLRRSWEMRDRLRSRGDALRVARRRHPNYTGSVWGSRSRARTQNRGESRADRQARPDERARAGQKDPAHIAARPDDLRRSLAALPRHALRGHRARRPLQGQLPRDQHHEGLSQLLVRGAALHLVGPQEIQRGDDGDAERRRHLQGHLDALLRRLVLHTDQYRRLRHGGLEVKRPPQGMELPALSMAKKPLHLPNRLRKFMAKNSAGLRIRAHPSLQSKQIGVVPTGNTIVYCDEIHNDDGVWLRLNVETINKYCNSGHLEAWCLQYNQHLGKTLLLPVEEPKASSYQLARETLEKKKAELNDEKKKSAGISRGKTMAVVTCGASGHNIRSRPSLKAGVVGMLALGNTVTVQEYTPSKAIANHRNHEAFASAASEGQENEQQNHKSENSFHNCVAAVAPMTSGRSVDVPNNSFLFGNYGAAAAAAATKQPQQQQNDSLASHEKTPTDSSVNLSKNHLKDGKAFKEKESGPGAVGKLSVLQKWLRGEDKSHNEKKSSPGRDFSEFVGVSVKELVKAMGESRQNGNGATPPDTPRRTSRCSSPKNPPISSRSSSPITVPVSADKMVDSISQRRGSTPSDTSALVSSLTRDPSPGNTTRGELSPSPSFSSLHMRSEESNVSPPETPRKELHSSISCDSQDALKKVSEAQTQTSPESVTTAMKGHFSTVNATNATKEDRHLSKLYRRDHTKVVKNRVKRAISPANNHQIPSPSRTLNLNKEKVSLLRVSFGNSSLTHRLSCVFRQVKEAISPSVAECLRAVFAAFLWHEGIVHDAMACASFLKFHPSLPKQPTTTTSQQQTNGGVARQQSSTSPVLAAADRRHEMMTREERARQRYSVEVSNDGNYLHIQPSTLESLTRSAANANANRSRKKADSSAGKEDAVNNANKLTSLPEFATILPPALKGLVQLWEELSINCLQAIDQQTVVPSPLTQPPPIKLGKREAAKSSAKDHEKRLEEEHERRLEKIRTLGQGAAAAAAASGGTRRRRCCCCCCCWIDQQRGKGDDLRALRTEFSASGDVSHEAHASGLRLARRRQRLQQRRQLLRRLGRQLRRRRRRRRKNKRYRRGIGDVNKLMSPLASPDNDDTHMIVKSNAMFLLDLASAAGVSIPKHQRRPSQTLSSVAENHSPPEPAGPFPTQVPFQCLLALGVNNSQSYEDHVYEELLRRQNSLQDSQENSIILAANRRVDAGSSLLCYPSAALQKLCPTLAQSAGSGTNNSSLDETISPAQDKPDLLMRPVMLFVLQQHNLQHLQFAMKQALRRAACRVYAMQALNWLLRSVTQPICLHDLLWWFVASLTPIPPDPMDINEDDNRKRCLERRKDHDMVGVCEHPLSDLVIAGEAANPLPTAFHNLLQTIADLMLLPAPGSPLQQAAVRCWAIQFTAADHMFLHRSHVFSNISKILSRSEEEEDAAVSMHKSHQSNLSGQFLSSVETLKDLTPNVAIKTSSRQAMISSLTDNSTETFWESGDEDRDKTKTISITCAPRSFPRMVYIHIDNCRDLTAIRKETTRLREEWETLLCSPTPVNSVMSENSDLPKAADTYCFEMLSMVLALSGSSVGRNYLSHQGALLKDLLSLLHTGSARVQRQVISLLRRILPEIKPEAFAEAIGAEKLPPSDFSIISAADNGYALMTEFDEHSMAIMDVFLSCIAKALTVQVKMKDKENNAHLQQSRRRRDDGDNSVQRMRQSVRRLRSSPASSSTHAHAHAPSLQRGGGGHSRGPARGLRSHEALLGARPGRQPDAQGPGGVSRRSAAETRGRHLGRLPILRRHGQQRPAGDRQRLLGPRVPGARQERLQQGAPVRPSLRRRQGRAALPAVSAALRAQLRPQAGRRRHVHDLLHRGPGLRPRHSAALRPRLPLALLQDRADEALGRAEDHLQFQPVSHLQGAHGKRQSQRAVGQRQELVRRRQEKSSHAIGVRRFTYSRSGNNGRRSILSRSSVVRNGQVRLLRLLQMPESLLRWRGPLRRSASRRDLRPHGARLRGLQRRGSRPNVSEARHRLSRVQVPLLLLRGRIFCFGTTHFCKPCHDDFQRVTNIPKNELPTCPAENNQSYNRHLQFEIVETRERTGKTLKESFAAIAPRPTTTTTTTISKALSAVAARKGLADLHNIIAIEITVVRVHIQGRDIPHVLYLCQRNLARDAMRAACAACVCACARLLLLLAPKRKAVASLPAYPNESIRSLLLGRARFICRTPASQASSSGGRPPAHCCRSQS
ncbi:unnamed protein product [Trichogramma brassicae]|uniref:DOC domain-containing protein n=1 Tax=Trichogramma brassicae TaxID=86971 RepID=A0A6H5ITE1_9HYME|nr:unnamed protein product [Trichogramma brassicae]